MEVPEINVPLRLTPSVDPNALNDASKAIADQLKTDISSTFATELKLLYSGLLDFTKDQAVTSFEQVGKSFKSELGAATKGTLSALFKGEMDAKGKARLLRKRSAATPQRHRPVRLAA